MIETGENLDFAQETVGQILTAGEIRQQNFHGFYAVGNYIPYLEDLPHAASAKDAENFIISNTLADLFVHRKPPVICVNPLTTLQSKNDNPELLSSRC